jgi:hypothetical protein
MADDVCGEGKPALRERVGAEGESSFEVKIFIGK